MTIEDNVENESKVSIVLGRCEMKIDQFTRLMMAVRGQRILSVCGRSLSS